jgi:hypothetical protein
MKALTRLNRRWPPARNFAQVANMPVVLIEGDRNQEGAKQRGFDWEDLKTAYNGRSVRTQSLRALAGWCLSRSRRPF